MAGARLDRIVETSPVGVTGHTMEAPAMNHPDMMLMLVKDRHDQYRREADEHRLARQHTSVPRQSTRERFRIRDLRWTLMRPAEA